MPKQPEDQGAIISGGQALWVDGNHPDADLVLEADTAADHASMIALRDDLREKLNAPAPVAAALSAHAQTLTWLQRLGRGEVRYVPSRKETAPDGR